MKTGVPSKDWPDFNQSQSRMEILGESWEMADQTKVDLDRQFYFSNQVKPFLQKIQ